MGGGGTCISYTPDTAINFSYARAGEMVLVTSGETVLVQNPHVLGQYSLMNVWNTGIVHKVVKIGQLGGKFGIRDLSEHGSENKKS